MYNMLIDSGEEDCCYLVHIQRELNEQQYLLCLCYN
jgi:hypothetical protein